MPDFIQTETLRTWLEEKRPVTVLDVRSDEDRAQWSIPGSIHYNAYEALKAGKSDALAGLELPSGIPIVTVCNLGRMSERAAQALSARGLPTFSLEGGMKAWSLAWNTAEVDVAGVHVTQIRRTGKGCLSYLVASGPDALVIDASLPPEVYLALSERQDARVRYVLDTHIHADHLSRSRQLAEGTGGELLLPEQSRASFRHRPIANGEEIRFGHALLKAIRTPGHTLESTCYFVGGHAIFTGDTLFISGVGRPDLHAAGDEARGRARLLYSSLEQLIALGPEVVVFPGHASEPVPFDAKALRARLGEITPRLQEWLSSEDSFVKRILARIPPTPPNYGRITELNEKGELPPGDLTELEAGANRCAVS